MRKILLFPFSVVYGLAISLRNFLYNKKILKSTKFSFPIILIGNLSTGGTGKTPHTNYLINLLKKDYNMAVLSRGYNRKTSGYIELQTSSKALQVGDEPLFYKWKHPNIKVAVCEDRVFGISNMAINEEKDFVFLLDDAFQHRAIKAGLNIVLTEYSKLYTRDFLLPAGNLREHKSGMKRADIIVVTKCPSTLSAKEKIAIIEELNVENYQYVFFSSIQYNEIYSVFNSNKIENKSKYTALIISAIASPDKIIVEVESQFKKVYLRSFQDHHNFTQEDIYSIIRTFENIEEENKILLTTEKDITRLFAYKDDFVKANIDIFCLPIEVKFDDKEKLAFDNAIKHYLNITLPKIEEEIEQKEIL